MKAQFDTGPGRCRFRSMQDWLPTQVDIEAPVSCNQDAEFCGTEALQRTRRPQNARQPSAVGLSSPQETDA